MVRETRGIENKGVVLRSRVSVGLRDELFPGAVHSLPRDETTGPPIHIPGCILYGHTSQSSQPSLRSHQVMSNAESGPSLN